MIAESINEIREAVTTFRGGWENASDEALRELWQSFDADLRHAYLSAVRGRKRLSGEQQEPSVDD